MLADTVRFGGVLTEQKQQIADLRQHLQLRVDAMAMRLGEVNAHVIRLDALGKRLTEMASIDSHEFNFDRDPPTGGPESDGEGVSAQQIRHEDAERRAAHDHQREVRDPLDGREAFHKGVDFAGTAGSEVVAVAAGIVTWAGERSGFGKLVEINHGDGYLTRYAHNERTLVSVGQTVKRGEPVALMGSTGRSTGPHVHFEVVRNGRPVDPLTFIGR